MKKAGEGVRTAQGLLVVRAPGEDHADIGDFLLDDQLDEIGRVVDVFGPVDRPYVAVTPNAGERPASYLGKSLYRR
ncbi:H/ACA ribonucleoprotein complex subunit GAR1 [Halocalculus aciditolerans]|uniref:H/ACA RNA-protein complex protein Gar1 n=1 Tax=Halocalculus aciditolerans TaxID=1383812 RepID=A0A830FKX3_9EURY|nr:Gar1/Naf1 family protein [Halocalculus aciditolerans]GGL56534.1 H/ACA RNA-protein complex protein Gar1 [Halocalculus aciditolerans]